MSQSPALEEVIDEAILAHMDTVWTAVPGRIVAYDAQNRRASVQPDVQQHLLTPDGNETWIRLPVLRHVPIMQFGNASLSITAPVEVGDTVLMVFMSCEIDDWKTNPRAQAQGKGGNTKPKTFRRFSLGDAVAIPGLLQFASINTGAGHADDRIQIGSSVGPKVEVDQGHVYLGGSASLLDPKPDKHAVNETALDHFMQALVEAAVSIAISNPPGAGALVALFDKLTGGSLNPLSPPTSFGGLWSPGVTKTFVK